MKAMIVTMFLCFATACAISDRPSASHTSTSEQGLICDPCDPNDINPYVQDAIDYGQTVFSDAIAYDATHQNDEWEVTCVVMETSANPFEPFLVRCGNYGSQLRWSCSWEWGYVCP